MAVFDNALVFILAREGGYANNPADPGGATMKGITQRVYDDYRDRAGNPRRPVRQIADEEVASIYKRQYWVDGRCEEIAQSHPKVALCHMDCAVNSGISQAARLLQRAIGGVDVDGIIGPKTLGALRAQYEPDVLARYLDLRAEFYRSLGANRPTLNQFVPGWLARLRHVARATDMPIAVAFAESEARVVVA